MYLDVTEEWSKEVEKEKSKKLTARKSVDKDQFHGMLKGLGQGALHQDLENGRIFISICFVRAAEMSCSRFQVRCRNV